MSSKLRRSKFGPLCLFSQGALLHQYNGAEIIPVVSAYALVPVFLSLSISCRSGFLIFIAFLSFYFIYSPAAVVGHCR